MALRHFAGDARVLTEQAVEIARELGSSSVEAEHLLLAASGASGPAADVLRSSGLDFDGIASALVAEMERSLAAVGVHADPLVFSADVSRPRFGTSAKVALERTLKTAVARGEKPISCGHLVLGVLAAERGTVPRALECAGVDRDALRAEISAALNGEQSVCPGVKSRCGRPVSPRAVPRLDPRGPPCSWSSEDSAPPSVPATGGPPFIGSANETAFARDRTPICSNRSRSLVRVGASVGVCPATFPTGK